MALSKRFALFTLICVICAFVIAPSAGAVKYPVPKPKGGNGQTKKPAKNLGKKLQNTSVSKLANGFHISVKFSKPGTVMCVIKHNTVRLGSGTVTANKRGSKQLNITFNPTGKNFLKQGAGKKVTIICTFTPKKKGGKIVTSTATVTLG